MTVAWKADGLDGLSRGSRVWVMVDGGAGWQLGTLQSAGGSSCAVVLDASGAAAKAKPANVVPANPALLDSVEDLTHLSFLNQPSILHALQQRYAAGNIYTHAGPVLIAVNPFQTLPMYGPEQVQHYTGRSRVDVTEGYAPHVFLTADKAYKQMCTSNQCQSVLITGESGAGKTETTKIMMRYLAGLAGGTGMEDKVLGTNPLLEAFGNAKTIHNNNSSRFGKLIEIYFSSGTHQICGALIHTYLLEKSRVVHQLPQERSYHIFYQLCRGATPEERHLYQLPDALDSFDYLNRSGCTSIAGVDDAAAFRGIKLAMSAVGITSQQQQSIFSVLSAILWLGNICFQPLSEDAVSVAPASGEAVQRAASLLRCPEAALYAALKQRKLVAGGERITRHLNLDAALDNRDALAKALYAELFSWLVDQVNKALAVGKQRTGTSLSILDIYGFECFKENSFEQLCINYANERLQQQFNKHLFKLDQAAYESEGIDWAHVEFEDNQECVDLIEARPPQDVGILSLLDEECIYPRGSDSSFATKLRQRQGSHPRFSYNPKVPTDDFTLHHYAGPVVYSCTKFLDKNKDTLSPDLVLLLRGSQEPLVQALAVEMALEQDRKGTQTVGSRFRAQLQDLIQRLDATALHFIRCIKPNSQQVPSHFQPQLVLHQLKCCGVLEVTRIARAGYPTRYRHEQFAERYKVLLPEHGAGCMTPLETCTRLLQHFSVDRSMYQVGRTKLFFRAGVLGQLEDTWARIQRSVLYLQSMWRMVTQRRVFLRLRHAAVVLQSHWRGRQGRLLFAEMQRQHNAAVAIQAVARGYLQRQRYFRVLQAAVCIQMAWRRWQVNQRIGVRVEARLQWEAEQRAILSARRHEEESFDAIQHEFGMDAGQIREILALWQRYGGSFLSWMEQQEDADLAAAAAAVDGVDTSDLQSKISTLETYSLKLERQVADLQQENGLLHHAVEVLQQGQGATVQGHCQIVGANAISPTKQRPDELASTSGAKTGHVMHNLSADGTAAGTASIAEQRRRSTRRSDDEISFMSLSDDDSSLSTAMTGTPQGRTPLTSAQGLPSAQEEGRAAIASLDQEFEKKRALFDDDADFIREVRDGLAEAPGMNPDMELKRLVQRYKVWKKSFKSRLAATQSAVKHSRRAESGRMLHSQSSAAGGMHAGSRLQPQPQRLTSQDSQVSLTSRLFKTRGGR